MSESELKQWIKFTQQRYIYEDAERQLKANDLNLDGRVEWEEYRNATYGFVTQDGECMCDKQSSMRLAGHGFFSLF